MSRISRRLAAMAVATCAASAGIATPSVAQVRYAPAPVPFIPFASPYDESYDTHPSYQVGPAPYGYPTVRVIQRCAYLGGWNVGDFHRDVDGTPLGVDHTCPEDEVGSRVRARY